MGFSFLSVVPRFLTLSIEMALGVFYLVYLRAGIALMGNPEIIRLQRLFENFTVVWGSTPFGSSFYCSRASATSGSGRPESVSRV